MMEDVEEDFGLTCHLWSADDLVDVSGQYVLVRGFVQENHKIIFSLSTERHHIPVQPAVIYQEDPRSPFVRLIAMVSTPPNDQGQLKLHSSNFQQRARPAVFLYEAALAEYITLAKGYLRVLSAYASKAPSVDTTAVFQSYTLFIEANHRLMAMETLVGDGRLIEDYFAIGPGQNSQQQIPDARQHITQVHFIVFFMFIGCASYALMFY